MSITVRILYLLLEDRLKDSYLDLIGEIGREIRVNPLYDDKLVGEKLFLEVHQSEAFRLIEAWDWEEGVDGILEMAQEEILKILRGMHPELESPDKEARVTDHSLRIKALATLIQDYAARKGGAPGLDLPIQEAEAIYNKMMKEG